MVLCILQGTSSLHNRTIIKEDSTLLNIRAQLSYGDKNANGTLSEDQNL